MMAAVSRRLFIFLSGILVVIFAAIKLLLQSKSPKQTPPKDLNAFYPQKQKPNLGVAHDGRSYVFSARNGSPEDNTRKVIELFGGIEKIIDPTDIVLIKPNAQWWNQGMTNTNAMKEFIKIVLEIPNFTGEIIIAENHHFPEDDSRGWTTGRRNGDYNLNELVSYFQERGYKNVTKYHWHDGGPSNPNTHGGAENGGIITGPDEGDGYIWRDDLIYAAETGRRAMMSYPVFTSKYSGIKIDFKKGPWQDGRYLDNNLKFINFSILNHHMQTGITASIKNYLGICDMTCGFRGTTPKGFYNFHHVAVNTVHWRLKQAMNFFGWEERLPSIGGCVGYFMKNIRMADLNIITAEWTGYGSRTNIRLREHTKTILASTDPVAIDYVAAKRILLPATLQNKATQYASLNDPDKFPFHDFLSSCYKEGIGCLNSERIIINDFDFALKG